MIRAFGGRRIGVMALAVLLALCALAAAQGKPKIAVYVTGAAEQSTNKALGTMILTGLVGGGQYQMVERSEEFQKQLEAEHVKQRSGAIADDQIKALGMQFGVDFVCIADITPVLGAYLISARIVNVETAQVIAAANTNSPLKTIDDLTAAVAALFGVGPAQNQQAKSPAIAAFERGNAAKMNKDYDLAIREYTEAMRLDPSNSDNYYFYRAQVYRFNKKDYDNAIADYSEAIRIKPSYVRYYSRGDVYLEKRDYAKAIADYEESLRLKPDDTAVKDKISVARGRAGVGGGSVADAPKPQAQSAAVSGDNAAKSGSADVPKTAAKAADDVKEKTAPASQKTHSGASGGTVAPKTQTGAKSGTVAKADATFVDSRDGKKYRTVKIGNQIWMAENLNYKSGGSKCLENESDNCDKYGRLYNWSAAKKACPAGWHTPSDAEWTQLAAYVGGTAGKKLRSTTGWRWDRNGTDEHGFSALPGGNSRHPGNAGIGGSWWSATLNEDRDGYAWSRDMYYPDDELIRLYEKKAALLSVRCIAD